jgi:hypothetical protein
MGQYSICLRTSEENSDIFFSSYKRWRVGYAGETHPVQKRYIGTSCLSGPL